MFRTSELLTLMWVCPSSCLKTFFIFKCDSNFITTPIKKQTKSRVSNADWRKEREKGFLNKSSFNF